MGAGEGNDADVRGGDIDKGVPGGAAAGHLATREALQAVGLRDPKAHLLHFGTFQRREQMLDANVQAQADRNEEAVPGADKGHVREG